MTIHMPVRLARLTLTIALLLGTGACFGNEADHSSTGASEKSSGPDRGSAEASASDDPAGETDDESAREQAGASDDEGASDEPGSSSGKEVQLRRAAPGNDGLVVGKTRDAMKTYREAKAKHRVARGLAQNRQLLMVAAGTTAVVTERDDEYTRVEITGGRAAGKTGWVPNEWIHSANE